MNRNLTNIVLNYSFVFALILVALSVIISLYSALFPYIEEPYRDLSNDIDWGFLNRGLDRIHCFKDTSRWWVGTWCGEVPFWRPLTSYVFLVERLLWHKEYLLPRQIVLECCHVIFILFSASLLWRLTRRNWLVLITIWLFAGARPFPISYLIPTPPSVLDTLYDPKNIPEPLAGTAIVACLLSLSYGRWVLAVVLAAISVCFKEIGFTAWPLALITLAWLNKRKVLARGGLTYVLASIVRHKAAVAVWLVVLAGLGFIHWFSVGVGYSIGSNTMWWWRAIIFLSGRVITTLLPPVHAAVVISCLAFGFVLLLRRYSIVFKLLGVLVAFAVGVVIDARQLNIPWQVSMARMLLIRGELPLIIVSIFWLWAAWQARRDWQTVVLGLAMAVASSAPSFLVTQAIAHTRYIASIFLSMVPAAAICCFVSHFARDESSNYLQKQ